jgi:hypothetical protein
LNVLARPLELHIPLRLKKRSTWNTQRESEEETTSVETGKFTVAETAKCLILVTHLEDWYSFDLIDLIIWKAVILNLAVGMNKMTEIYLRNFALVPELHTLKIYVVIKSSTRISYTSRPRKKQVHGRHHAAVDFTLGDKAVSTVVTRDLVGHEGVLRQYMSVP